VSTLTINGAELFAVEEGEGEPIVLVHGTLADYRTWLLQVRGLSKRHRVIAYSRRYHFPNVTAERDPRYSIGDQARDLAEIIRSRAGGSAHVVSSSFGGCIALELAVASPGLLRSLVLCEPPLMPWLLKSEAGRQCFPSVREAREASNRAFSAGNQVQGVRLFTDMALGAGVFDAMPPRSQSRIMDNAFELSLEMATAVDVYFPQLTCERLQHLTLPVLLLGAERSPSYYGVIADELAACLPRAERRRISSSAHIMHSTNPAAFNEVVGQFVDRS
jgi:non-heme chloroperoxidase